MRIIFHYKSRDDITLWAFHDCGKAEHFKGVTSYIYDKAEAGKISMKQVYRIMRDVCVGMNPDDYGVCQLAAAEEIMEREAEVLAALADDGKWVSPETFRKADEAGDEQVEEDKSK